MANCPNCGSNHIQLKRETDVNWGRAISGLVLFGVVGGAIGAITGEDKNVNACLDCGTSWKASDLYKILQFIKDLTNITPDLTEEIDRLFVNRVMLEIPPCIEAISEAAKIIKDSEDKKARLATQGCGFGCLTSIFAFSCLAILFAANGLSFIFLMFLITSVVGVCIGIFIYNKNVIFIQEEIESTKRKAFRMKIKAEENFRLKVEELIDSYGMRSGG
jgi:hypothetical protein